MVKKFKTRSGKYVLFKSFEKKIDAQKKAAELRKKKFKVKIVDMGKDSYGVFID